MTTLNVLNKCVKNGLTIAFAESMTGGSACYELIKNPGASKVVKGGMTLYQKEIKSLWLNIDSQIIDAMGLVSQELSDLLAYRIHQQALSSIGIGITGNAGPTKDIGDAGYFAYISIYYKDNYTRIALNLENLSREQAIKYAIHELYRKLDEII